MRTFCVHVRVVKMSPYNVHIDHVRKYKKMTRYYQSHKHRYIISKSFIYILPIQGRLYPYNIQYIYNVVFDFCRFFAQNSTVLL